MQELLPPPDPEDLLRRCHSQPEIVCLDGGPGAWRYLALPQQCRWLATLDDLPEISEGSADTSPRSWPAALMVAICCNAITACRWGCTLRRWPTANIMVLPVAWQNLDGLDQLGPGWSRLADGGGPEADGLRKILDGDDKAGGEPATLSNSRTRLVSRRAPGQGRGPARGHRRRGLLPGQFDHPLPQLIFPAITPRLTLPYFAACARCRRRPTPCLAAGGQRRDARPQYLFPFPECYLQGDGSGLRSGADQGHPRPCARR